MHNERVAAFNISQSPLGETVSKCFFRSQRSDRRFGPVRYMSTAEPASGCKFCNILLSRRGLYAKKSRGTRAFVSCAAGIPRTLSRGGWAPGWRVMPFPREEARPPAVDRPMLGRAMRERPESITEHKRDKRKKLWRECLNGWARPIVLQTVAYMHHEAPHRNAWQKRGLFVLNRGADARTSRRKSRTCANK